MNIAALVILSISQPSLCWVLSESKKGSASDWAIEGSSLGIFMIAAGAAGTRIGGAGTYGVAGDVMSEESGICGMEFTLSLHCS